MKSQLHFFSQPSYFPFSPTQSPFITMNNVTNLRWLLPTMVGLLAFVASSTNLMGQTVPNSDSKPTASIAESLVPCGLLYASSPVVVNVVIDPVYGTITLERTTLVPTFINSNCPITADLQVNFYADLAKTMPLGNAIDLTCAEVGALQTYYVAVWDGVDPATESPAVQLSVTVLDQTAPQAAAPANIVGLSADPGVCTATGIAGIAMASVGADVYASAAGTYTDNSLTPPDDCNYVTISYALSGATNKASTAGSDAGVETFNSGVTTVTYTITDTKYSGVGSGTVTVSFTVEVLDAENPSITCPADIVASANATCQYIYAGGAATAMDNCPGVVITNSVNGGSTLTGNPFAPGHPGTAVYNVTWTATDGAGNFVTCPQTISVTDNTLPVVTCPANTTVHASMPIPCTYTVAGTEFNPLSASDNCTTYTLSNSETGALPLAGTTFGIFTTTTITWTATDPDGNAGTCSFDVTVDDITVPSSTHTFPTSYTVNVTPGDCSAAVTIERPSLTATPSANFTINDCDLVSTNPTEGPAVINGTVNSTFMSAVPAIDVNNALTKFVSLQFPVGLTEIPYTWTDGSGNEITVTISVQVNENEPPVANCSVIATTLALDPLLGYAEVTPAMINNGSSDNCGIAFMEVNGFGSPITPNLYLDCANTAGVNVVTLTVYDHSGLSSQCNAFVIVHDNTPPVVSCPGNLNLSSLTSCLSAPQTMQLNFNNAYLTSSNDPGEYYDNAYFTYNDALLTPDGLNCGNNVNVSWTVQNPDLSTGSGFNGDTYEFMTGTSIVSFELEDLSGNVSSCNFTVNVSDLTGPVFDDSPANVPDNGSSVNLTTATGGCGRTYTWAWPTVTDACSPPTTSILQTPAPGSFFPFGSTPVTYVAQDAEGNISTYSFNVVITDNQPPVAHCKDVTVSLSNVGTASVLPDQIDLNSTDNCYYDYVSTGWNFTCANVGLNTVTLTIVDGSGNIATCPAVVTVQDNIAPTAVCANITNLDLTAAGTLVFPATSLNNGSTDNCAGSLTYLVSIDGGTPAASLSLNCSHIGTHVITLHVSDGTNTATCSKTVTVRDVTAPTFTVPAGVVIACSASTLPSNTGIPTNITDACDPAPVYTYTDAFVAGSCPNNFGIVRTWKVSDHATPPNMATAIQIISIVDNVGPVFAMPTTYTFSQTNSLSCVLTSPVTVTAANISDNCSADANIAIAYRVDYPVPSYGLVSTPLPTSTFVAGNTVSSFPIGTTQVTFRATDECGNIAYHTIAVTVTDDAPPTIIEPFGYSLGNTVNICNQTFTIPNATGNCGNTFAWYRPFRSDYDFADCLNHDVEELVSNPGVESALNASYPFDYNTPSLFSVHPNVFFPVGTTTITYRAIDAEGNIAVCPMTVVVEDVETPALTCPANQVLAATCPTATVPNYLSGIAISDNCPNGVTLTQSPAAGTTLSDPSLGLTPLAGETFVVTVTGTDNNNTTTCTFNVTLEDGDAPIPTVNPLPNIINFCGSVIVPAPTATDPCNPSAPIIYGTPSAPVGTLIPGTPPMYNLLTGNYVITWVYDDGNGNITTQLQNITVLADVFPPEAKCKGTVNLNLNTAGQVSITAATIDNGSNDPNNCGAITLSASPLTYTCSNIGSNIATLTVTDNHNNTAQCTSTIIIHDVTPPVLTGVPANITLEACTAIPVVATPTATDVCDASVTISMTEVSNQQATGCQHFSYVITRTWTATDDSGNVTVGTQTITVADTQAPVFSAATPSTITVYTDPNRLTCDDTVNLNMNQYISDCATGSFLTVTNNFNPVLGGNLTGIYPVGTYNFVFTATDACGHSTTKAVTVMVKDGTPPVAACFNGVSVTLNPSGTALVVTNQINDNSFDNCSGVLDIKIKRLLPGAVFGNSISFDCSDADGVTQHQVLLQVVDAAGNTAICQTYVVVQDNVLPTITSCPANVTIDCADDPSPATTGTAIATDNCPTNVVVTYTDTPQAGSGTICSYIKRTWTAEDLAGNTAVCTQTIGVEDTQPPMFTAYPVNATISCNDDLVDPPAIGAIDDCSSGINVVYAQQIISQASGDCGDYSYVVRRTWTATDACNNTSVHTQLITVQDIVAPLFLGAPTAVTINSASFAPTTDCTVPVSLNIASYISDCSTGADLHVTNNAPHGDGLANASGNYAVGTYTITFHATDACGNSSTHTVALSVVDNTTPTAICNNDVVIALGTTGSATIDYTIIDLGSFDNCGIVSYALSQSTFDCSDLGIQPLTMTITDTHGNTNSCTVDVEVQAGGSTGFTLAMSSTPTTYYGASTGTATATPTGGSGNFTYSWSNMAATSTITGLLAGTYTVTVIDTDSNCQQVGTVTVAQGPKVKFDPGEIVGSTGTLMQLPVTVQQFNNLVSVQYMLVLTNPGIAEFTGNVVPNSLLTNFNANAISPDTLIIAWFNPSLAGVTLAQDAVMFSAEVLLTGGLSTSTPVIVTGTAATPVEVQQLFGTNLTLVPVDVMTGTISINDAPTHDIAGDIRFWSNNNPVSGVTVNLGGTYNDVEVTSSLGTYDFLDLATNSATVVTPTKSTAGNVGIYSNDLTALIKHALGVTAFTSPYQWVAANANGDNIVTLQDYGQILEVVLGQPHLDNGIDWKFIPKTYVFPTPPLSAPVPSSISHNPILQDWLDDDFVAVRMGDITGDAPTSISSDAQDRYDSKDLFKIKVLDRAFKAGELVEVPFVASNFDAMTSYQFTMTFDATKFELQNIEPGVLEGLNLSNFGTAFLSEGNLTTAWASGVPVTVTDNEVLFTLVFKAQTSGSTLSKSLRSTAQVIKPVAFDAEGKSNKLQLEFLMPNGETAEVFELFQNRPNPFKGATTIGFNLPQEGRATMKIFSVNGKLLKTVVGDFAKGYNELEFKQSDFGGAGIFWYELETTSHSDRKKMILIE